MAVTLEQVIAMMAMESRKWLLLIHQIPPKLNALRVRIWRRLQRIGAVAIKQTVYVMPFSEQSIEDLSWMLKEIVEGGGEGSISETRFLEGLTDESIIGLFQSARKPDYEGIIQDANLLLSRWSTEEGVPRKTGSRASLELAKLRHRFEEISSIDFFQAPEHAVAASLIKELEASLASGLTKSIPAEQDLENLKGKTWVTRKNLFVDRIACGWLIRRFLDESATFRFVDERQYSPDSTAVRFDMFDGEYSHVGDQCTFEVMIQSFGLQDPALALVAEVVHDIDLKDDKYNRTEGDGFHALLTGLVSSQPDDELRMEEGFRLFENLYAYFNRHARV